MRSRRFVGWRASSFCQAYSEDLHAISKYQAREKGKKEIANSTILLKGVNAERFHKEFIVIIAIDFSHTAAHSDVERSWSDL